MAHFANLEPGVRARLEARGIDPELSHQAWVDAIRNGSFRLRPDGLPARHDRRSQRGHPFASRPRPLTPIPLAVVVPASPTPAT